MSLTAENLTTHIESDVKPATAERERQPESVLKLLLDRVEHGYRRGIDDDGHKIGIAFDAGGMAGVVSGAMAQELDTTGILQVVDGFYGLSAGGFNALYIAAGQIEEGMGIYTDVFPDNGFIDLPKAVPPKKPTMNLDVLRETVYKTRKLNVRKIIEEKIPVVLGATDLTDPLKRPVIFRSVDLRPEEADKLIEQAIAGSHIPIVAGEPVNLEDGKRYTDATMSWSSTVELARADGCTDVLSLSNSPLDSKEPSSGAKSARFVIGRFGDRYLDRNSPKLPKWDYQPSSWGERLFHPLNSLERRILAGLVGDTGKNIWDIHKYTDVLDRKARSEELFRDQLFVEDGVNVERLYPPDMPELPELLTMDKSRLRAGVIAGSLAVRSALRSLGSRKPEDRTLEPKAQPG
jgi:predicted patatin/cPLA2 family phospholipase